MGDLMTKAEALSLLPAWEVMEAKSCTARAFRTVVALTDEVERLRATDLVALMQRIDNPKIRVMPHRYLPAGEVLVFVTPDVYQRLLAASTPDEVTP